MLNDMLKGKMKDPQYIDMASLLIKESSKYFTEREVLLIKKAYLMARDLHRGQKRESGEPYINHPLYVAYILLNELNLHNASSIAAALLHDTIEDCGITEEFLITHFNHDVASLVLGVTKMKDLDFSSKEEKEDYNNYLLLKYILEDYRVIYIKLADRMHNMRTLEYKNEAKRREKSAESLRIFVPLATHVGASIARSELADISFKYLNNRSYREIAGMSKDYQIKHIMEIERNLEKLKYILASIHLTPQIRARVMSNFAIYQRLIDSKKISLLPNLISYEIMVDERGEIYQVVNSIQDEFQVIPQYTKDYVVTPKNNGYQAFHLSLRGHKGIPFQIRIFTKDMFLVNRYGFAALLDIYPNKSVREIQESLIKDNEFFQALDKNYRLYKKPLELIDRTVRELLGDKIYVYVENKERYCLPETSTVADLASKIHSELRKEAIKAIVNGNEVGLDFPLKENDHVIILTKKKMSDLSLDSKSRILKK